MDHIDDMEILRQGIGLVGYGQKDPVVEYKMRAFEMFNDMIGAIQEDTVRMLYYVHVEQKIEREQVAKLQERTRMIHLLRNRFREKRTRFIRMIRVRAEAVRSTNSAVDVN